MAYHILVQRDTEEGDWGIQFGDKDKEVVREERNDYRDHGVMAKDIKILRVASSRQSACQRAVDELNAADARRRAR